MFVKIGLTFLRFFAFHNLFNPSDVVIMGNHITEEDVSSIKTHCASFISERHLPDIQFSNEIYENYVNGLIRQTLDSILFPFIV